MTDHSPTDLDPVRYLGLFDGDVNFFLSNRKAMGEGQAFYRALNENDKWLISDQGMLPTTPADPKFIQTAVAFLLDWANG